MAKDTFQGQHPVTDNEVNEYFGNCNITGERDLTPVRMSMDLLESSIESLAKSMDELVGRLEPVLAPRVEKAGACISQDPCPANPSPLNYAITLAKSRINMHVSAIESIIERLEV